MRRAMLVCSVLGAIFVGWGPSFVQARSLSDHISLLYGDKGITLTDQATPPTTPGSNPTVPHDAHFTNASLANLGNLVQQLAPSAADFPAVSSVPGLTFRYNAQLQVFERSSTSLGPIFVERPLTVGRGRLDFGFSYLYIDFDEFNGHDLDGLKFPKLAHNDCCAVFPNPPGQVSPPFEEDTADLTFDKFNLRTHVVSFFATYGITDRWDFNILLPVIFTSLSLRARADINDISKSNTHLFGKNSGCESGSTTVRCIKSVDDDKTGVGDLLLRTKYHLFDHDGFNIAALLALRVPTGDENNFQGLGDPTLTPFLVLSQEYGRFNLHATGGIEINFDDSDRSRARYAGGVTFKLIEQIALLVDVVGSSSLKTDRVSTSVPQFRNASGTSDVFVGNTIVTQSFRTDIVDLNVGFKISPFGTDRSIVGFGTVFIPLNNDGLRADAIPAVGLEVGF